MPNTPAHDRANAEQVRVLQEALQQQGVQLPPTPAQPASRSGTRVHPLHGHTRHVTMPAMTRKAKTPAQAPAKTTATPQPERSEASKLGKTQLVEQVAEKSGLTKKQAGEAVDALMETVVQAVQQGQSVGLPGLGTFSVKETAARTGVRPGTSERIQIPAGKKLAFKVATPLKGTL